MIHRDFMLPSPPSMHEGWAQLTQKKKKYNKKQNIITQQNIISDQIPSLLPYCSPSMGAMEFTAAQN